MSRSKHPVVAITGGIACGKSEVARIFEEEGFEVCDTDILAREVLEPGSPCLEKIIRHFGSDVIDREGRLDRKKMADRVFNDKNDRDALNDIIHPPIMERVRTWVNEKRQAGKPGAVVVPLLFEIGATEGWDAIVCVLSREELMMERMKRRGLTEHETKARILAQWPVEEKAKRSDYIIYNNSSLEILKTEARRICATLLGKE